MATSIPKTHENLKKFRQAATVRIDAAKNPESVVLVTDANEERFSVTFKRASHVLNADAIMRDQLDHLIRSRIPSWIQQNCDTINGAWITVADGGILFVVRSKSVEYDADFEDNLSDFAIEVANDAQLDKISLSVLSLPNVSDGGVDRFVNDRVLFQFKLA